jgi:hypothetical protein
MKRFNVFLTSVVTVSAGGLLAFAGAPAPIQSGKAIVESSLSNMGDGPVGAVYNLKTGRGRIQGSQISLMAAPWDSDGDGFYEAVLKVNLDPSLGYTKLRAVLDYEGVPTGFTLNIGDSATNDGGGGDAFTQQRDAEMQIQNQTMSVFASDLGGAPLNATRLSETLMGLRDSGLKVCVADMFLSHGSAYSELDFSSCPPGADLLYALKGQPDSEGLVNYDIYVGLNRVIYGAPFNGRIGSGLAKVYLTLE